MTVCEAAEVIVTSYPRKSATAVGESEKQWTVSSCENCEAALVSGSGVSKLGGDPTLERKPLKVLANLLRPPGRDMLRNRMIISDATMDLGVKEPSKILRMQLGCPQRPPPPNKANTKKVCNIKDKISEWEGKRESQSPLLTRKEADLGRKEESVVPVTNDRIAGPGVGRRHMPLRRLMSWELESKENDSRAKGEEKKPERTDKKPEAQSSLVKVSEEKGGNKREAEKEVPSVLCQVKRFEQQVLKDGSTETPAQFPGTYYSPQCLQEKAVKEQSISGSQDRPCTGQQRRAFNKDIRTGEPIFGTLVDARASGLRGQGGKSENAYTEPGIPEQKPFINPLPKPRRTFTHDGEVEVVLRRTEAFRQQKRSLPPLPSIPPPPLPTSPPPAVSRRRWNGKHKANADHRKSYEYEDLPQSALENDRAGWGAQNKLLARTLSEENVYEDILDTPSKENPYEDIEIDGQCLGKKYVSSLQASPTSSTPTTPNKIHPKPTFFRQNSERRSFKLLDLRKVNRDGTASPARGTSPPPSIPSSPDEAFFNSADPQNGRRRRKIPRLVLKINAIFEARRGKKRVKRLSQSTESSSGKVTDDNSESDSDTEEKLKAHSQRLVHVKSRVSQTPRYQTLERELLEYRKRQLFEYFLVVSLKKAAGEVYTPEVTQQFPLQMERSFKFMREAEDQLKAIPQFCFPDAKDWRLVGQFTSETFSFVLTGEDGSRRFGYCRRLLPGSKGKRLPEVYCIVSRLGCFNLFSKHWSMAFSTAGDGQIVMDDAYSRCNSTARHLRVSRVLFRKALCSYFRVRILTEEVEILDEVEKRRSISPALVQPFMRSIIEAPFPALGRTITVKNFLPGSGNEVIELCRPLDSRLEHVDFESLFASLSVRHLLRVFASLLLERRVIFMADTLSTLSKCCHAVVALIYPFAWQHTYIPVLPPAMIDIVCSPTPFLIGLLSSSLPRLKELPVEESSDGIIAEFVSILVLFQLADFSTEEYLVLVVDLVHNRFLRQMDDEDSILPRKLQAALEQILEQRNELFVDWVPGPLSSRQDSSPLNDIVSESFVRFFVEVVGHYSLFLIPGERDEKTLHREAFRKSVSSKSLRRFLEVFMETQMFGGFIQERELQKQGVKGLFEVRAQEYLETLPSSEQRGVNKFLKGLGNKMRFLHKR